MKSKSVEEVKSSYSVNSKDFKRGVDDVLNRHYAPLLTRNEELEKCIMELENYIDNSTTISISDGRELLKIINAKKLL